MTSHTFGDRLYFLRHCVKRLSRQRLTEKLNELAAKAPSDERGELTDLTADDMRAWEKGAKQPSVAATRVVARALGFAHELLDTSAVGDFSPDGFLTLAKQRGWSQIEIRHFWSVARERALFKGNPTSDEWLRIIETLTATMPTASQAPLFLDEFLCTHCGHWDSESHSVCPECGNVD